MCNSSVIGGEEEKITLLPVYIRRPEEELGQLKIKDEMIVLYAVAVFVCIFLILYMVSSMFSPKKLDIGEGHVLVTGGSSGIGKAIAVEAAKRGASITLLARNQAKLREAKSSVEPHLKDSSKQNVLCISVDLCKDYSAVEEAVRRAEEKQGPITLLVNCAGWSISGKFEDISMDDVKKLMDVNYMGSVYATRAVIGGMKEQGRGRIVLTSSQAGQIGLFGYSGYSASKYALRGLAESLQMEVKPYNIRVTLAFPPDTDTPGYEEENKHKPFETQIISETAGLFQPEYVAKCIMDDALAGRFFSYIGTDGWMLTQLTAGMSPATSVLESLGQFFIMGLLRLVGLVYLFHFDRIVRKCKLQREQHEKKL